MGQARNRMLQLSDSFPEVGLVLNKSRVGQISDKDALERSCVILMEELLKCRNALNKYIDAGCGGGTHFVNQKLALDKAMEILGL